MNVPYVTEKSGRNTKPVDLISRLLQDRIIYLSGPVTSEVADVIVMQLMWLNTDDPDADIDFYINSPGGSVIAGYAIKDIIHKISPNVNTIGIGECSSMGAYLLSSGTGVRKAAVNCRFMIHSVSSGNQGTVHDMKLEFEESMYMHNNIMRDMAEFSNTTADEMEKMSDRNNYMSTLEAIDCGFIDEVL